MFDFQAYTLSFVQIVDIKVNEQEPEWIVNFKKSIAGQLQIDITGVRNDGPPVQWDSVSGEIQGATFNVFEVGLIVFISIATTKAYILFKGLDCRRLQHYSPREPVAHLAGVLHGGLQTGLVGVRLPRQTSLGNRENQGLQSLPEEPSVVLCQSGLSRVHLRQHQLR